MQMSDPFLPLTEILVIMQVAYEPTVSINL